MHSAACINKSCDEPIDGSFNEKTCSKCSSIITDEHVQTFNEVREFIETKIEEMKDIACIKIYIKTFYDETF